MYTRTLEQRREYAEIYRPRRRIMDKLYYQKNREQILEKQRHYMKLPHQRARIQKYEKTEPRKKQIQNYRQTPSFRVSCEKSNEIRRQRRKNDPEWKKHLNQQHRESYQRHRHDCIEAAKKWRKNNPEKRLIMNLRHLTKYGLPFKITARQYKWALQSWSNSIMNRDDSICQVCGKPAEESHHILYKSLYPELALNLNNGTALCIECHYEVHGKAMVN